jgi:hypothetical protein
MIRIKYISILVTLLITSALNAQKDMNYTSEELKIKSKEELILLSQNLLKEKYPEIILNLNDFDIAVWRSEFGEAKVVYRRKIRYVANETKGLENINYDITINLLSNEIIPFDQGSSVFYTSSEKADKTIATLKEKGFLLKCKQADVEYTISENEEHYLISCFDNLHTVDKRKPFNQELPYISKTIVNKTTGNTLSFKGNNPFYFLNQISCNHYYNENLYAILNNENTSKNKTKIEEVATGILKDKYPNLKLNGDDFEMVILANYKDLIVKYRRFIRFNKWNKKTVYDLSVNIITKEVFPLDTADNLFYEPSSSDKKAIKTVQNNLTLERNSYAEHTISENEDYFWIASLNKDSMKKYIIDRKSNKLVWTNESYSLQMNNREDLSLQEHYKRMNQFFIINSDNMKPLTNMALDILKEKRFIPNINLDEYTIQAEASKNEVKIKFMSLVKYTPLRHKGKAKIEHDLNLNLMTQSLAQNPEQFYVSTKEDAMVIELIKSKLLACKKDFEGSFYPIEIIEEKDFFTIYTSDSNDLRGNAYTTFYRLDKETEIIEEVVRPSYFYPSPAMPPIDFNEVE